MSRGHHGGGQDLEPLDPRVGAALRSLGSVERDRQRSASARAMLMVAAAQRRERVERRRGMGWRGRLAVAGAGVAGVGSLLGGLVSASADALPNSPLYGVKRAVEAIELQLSDDDTSRARLELVYVDRRAEEALAMAQLGRLDLATQALRDAQPMFADARAVLVRDGSQGAREALQHASDSVTSHLIAVFQQVEARGRDADVMSVLNGLSGPFAGTTGTGAGPAATPGSRSEPPMTPSEQAGEHTPSASNEGAQPGGAPSATPGPRRSGSPGSSPAAQPTPSGRGGGH